MSTPPEQRLLSRRLRLLRSYPILHMPFGKAQILLWVGIRQWKVCCIGLQPLVPQSRVAGRNTDSSRHSTRRRYSTWLVAPMAGHGTRVSCLFRRSLNFSRFVLRLRSHRCLRSKEFDSISYLSYDCFFEGTLGIREQHRAKRLEDESFFFLGESGEALSGKTVQVLQSRFFEHRLLGVFLLASMFSNFRISSWLSCQFYTPGKGHRLKHEITMLTWYLARLS